MLRISEIQPISKHNRPQGCGTLETITDQETQVTVTQNMCLLIEGEGRIPGYTQPVL